MKKIIAFALLLISLSGYGQQDDSTKYIHYTYSYGTWIDRGRFDKVLRIPNDTIYTKTGIASKGGSLYFGNGTYWALSGSGGGSDGGIHKASAGNGLINVNDSTLRVDTLSIVTKQSRDKLSDSLGSLISLRALKSTTVSPGYGLTGGGDLSANRTISGDTTLLQRILSYSSTFLKNNNTLYFKNDTLVCDTCVFAYKDGRVGTYPSYLLDTTGLSAIAAGNAFLKMTGTKRIGVAALTPGITIGTTVITSGAAQSVIYESSANKVAETANFTFDGTKVLNIPATGQYNIGGLSALFFPDQSSFGKTMYIGNQSTGGSALSHSSSIQGGYDTYVGNTAGNANTTGQANTGVGAEALKVCTTCLNNTGVGADVFFSHVTGDNNTAVGKGAMQNGTGSSSAVAVGREALISNAAAFNTGVGDQSLFTNSSGIRNVGLGPQTGYFNATGNRNTWVGAFAGTGVTGNNNSNNFGGGYLALTAITTGHGNTATGDSVGLNITSGWYNSFYGNNAGGGITTGTNNLILGDGLATMAAGQAGSVVIGSNALRRIWINGNGAAIIGGSITNTDTTATGATVTINGTLQIKTPVAGVSTDKDSLVIMKDGKISTVRGDQTLSVNTSDVGNVGSGEDDLMTYTIPAGQLSTNNDRIEFEGVYQFTGSNNKTLKAYFGSQLLTSIGPGTSVAFITIKGTIIRTGAATQKASITMVSSSATYTYNVDISTPAETLSGTVVIKSTGTATSDNDIVQKSFIVKFYAAP